MSISPFPELLARHMRRIRASAADVASEIGISREAVNNWRNGLSMPNRKHRDRVLACAGYLRLTETEANELLQAAGFEAEFPGETDTRPQPYAATISHLFDRLASLAPYPIVMLLSQAHWGQPPCRAAIEAEAQRRYGREACVHIQPPYSVSVDSADYFAAVGRQCGLDGIDSDFAFEAALERRLAQGDRIFCLVSRFEQGIPAQREALAGILRSLSEMHSGSLHLLLCGGAALADLKYQGGDLSLLNIASVESWPEMGVGELGDLARHRRQLVLEADQAKHLLQLCGGHPVLAEAAIDHLADHGGRFDAGLDDALTADPRIWQALLPLLTQGEASTRVRGWLAQTRLARARPYLIDEALRQLYWANLIAPRRDDSGLWLEWRCEAIRRAGLMIAEQCASH